jgi:hypothetical protein
LVWLDSHAGNLASTDRACRFIEMHRAVEAMPSWKPSTRRFRFLKGRRLK